MDAVAASQTPPDAKPALRDFWGEFLALSLAVSGAAEGVVFRRTEAGPWEAAPPGPLPEGLAAFERGVLDDLAAAATRADDAFAAYPDDAAPRGHLLAFLAERTGPSVAVVLLRVTCTAAEAAREALRRAKAVRAMARMLRLREEAAQAAQRLGQFAAVLDLLTLLHAEGHFHSAAMLLCNEIAVRLRAERASLGWRGSGRLRLRAISHVERFERKMNVVAALESAMEEAVEQDDEILIPAPVSSILVTRDHLRFAGLENVAHLLTVPLRAPSGAAGALTIERAARPFDEAELQTLRLFGDHAGSLLDDLERRSRWFGARWLAALREGAARLLGFDHTWLKLAAIGVCAALAVLTFMTKTYRVEAPFTVRSDQEAQLPAPFDGYLSKVLVRPGDIVAEGAPLAELDTRELRLEEAAAAAEQTHHLSEASQARSEGKLSDMLIAQAGAARAKARLDLARYHIAQASIGAPMAGAVVEGDLREKIGAPVKQGDVLLRVVDLAQLHIEAEIPERDLAACVAAQGGELAFASRPRERAAFRIERIEPVAETREKGNIFVARALPVAPPETWWRPGMSGICKIDAGRRSLLWIIAHRTVDFFHTLLWW